MINNFVELDNSVSFVENGKGKEIYWGIDSKESKNTESQILHFQAIFCQYSHLCNHAIKIKKKA